MYCRASWISLRHKQGSMIKWSVWLRATLYDFQDSSSLGENVYLPKFSTRTSCIRAGTQMDEGERGALLSDTSWVGKCFFCDWWAEQSNTVHWWIVVLPHSKKVPGSILVWASFLFLSAGFLWVCLGWLEPGCEHPVQGVFPTFPLCAVEISSSRALPHRGAQSRYHDGVNEPMIWINSPHFSYHWLICF